VVGQKATLKGHVKDKITGEGIPFANVVVLSGEIQLGGTATDINGKYAIKPLPAGQWTIKSAAVGYQAMEISNTVLKNGQIRILDLSLTPKQETIEEVQIIAYKVPLIDKDTIRAGPPITATDIEKMPGRTRLKVARAVKNVSGNIYFVDGVRVSSKGGMPMITGRVIDEETGMAIPLASIQLFRGNKKIATTNSDADGQYVFAGIKAGQYVLKVKPRKYKSVTIEEIRIDSSAFRQMNIKLDSIR